MALRALKFFFYIFGVVKKMMLLSVLVNKQKEMKTRPAKLLQRRGVGEPRPNVEQSGETVRVGGSTSTGDCNKFLQSRRSR